MHVSLLTVVFSLIPAVSELHFLLAMQRYCKVCTSWTHAPNMFEYVAHGSKGRYATNQRDNDHVIAELVHMLSHLHKPQELDAKRDLREHGLHYWHSAFWVSLRVIEHLGLSKQLLTTPYHRSLAATPIEQAWSEYSFAFLHCPAMLGMQLVLRMTKCSRCKIGCILLIGKCVGGSHTYICVDCRKTARWLVSVLIAQAHIFHIFSKALPTCVAVTEETLEERRPAASFISPLIGFPIILYTLHKFLGVESGRCTN